MTSELPDLNHFDLDAAWRVGSSLVQSCRRAQQPVTIAIWLGEQRAFHAALPGSSADNDSWVERKARVVRRFGRPSLEVELDLARDDLAGFYTGFGLSPAEFAPSGGAVPILVRGVAVGVLAVSGLVSSEDHALAVAALRAEQG
ncbi:MAG: heme-degrading domain-containing protein [Janthinobacterium lividum]